MRRKPSPTEHRNRHLAARGRHALYQHALDYFCGDEKEARREMRLDIYSRFVDLLSDLRHLAELQGIDFDTAADMAKAHFRREQSGEEGKL